MKGELFFSAYMLLCLVGAATLTLRSRTKLRIGTFVLTFWTLGAAILHLDLFNLPLTTLGGQLQVQQLIDVILVGYLLVLVLIKKRNVDARVSLHYEKYFYLYIILFLVIVFYHWSNGMFNLKELRALAESSLVVLVIYVILRNYADLEMIEALWLALLSVAAISSVVSVMQFIINPDFLRIGSKRGAFAGFYRANGVFAAEYTNSYFLLSAIMVALTWVKSKRYRIILVLTYLCGILLSFHRMSWIITALILVAYFSMLGQTRKWKVILLAGIISFSVLLLVNEVNPFMSDVESSTLYQSRLSADTMTERLAIYKMILGRIDKVLVWGIGSSKSSVYYYGMMSIDRGRRWALGESGGIHNGYLEILFFYGLPLLLLFSAMLISVLIDFRRLFYEMGRQYILPFLFAVMYCLMNLTNAFPMNGSFGVLFGIIMGSNVAIAFHQIQSMVGAENNK